MGVGVNQDRADRVERGDDAGEWLTLQRGEHARDGHAEEQQPLDLVGVVRLHA
jgi:microcompartment protein CcmK/EutM